KHVNKLFKIKQFRKKKRSLHEATARKGRKHKNVISKRNEKNKKFSGGFYLNDKVRLFRRAGYITGFTGSSGAYVKTIDDDYITILHKNYKQVSLNALTDGSHNNNWQYEQNAFGFRQPKFISHLLSGLLPFTFLGVGDFFRSTVKSNTSR